MSKERSEIWLLRTKPGLQIGEKCYYSNEIVKKQLKNPTLLIDNALSFLYIPPEPKGVAGLSHLPFLFLCSYSTICNNDHAIRTTRTKLIFSVILVERIPDSD